jgi:hypothetical protein
MTLPISLATALLLAFTVNACDKGEEQAKAEEARREAEAKVADAEREANEKKAAAEREAAELQAKADAARVEARTALQKDIAAADRKAVDLKERATKAKGKAKLNAEAASAEFDKRRAVVEQDLQQLNTARGEAWDTLKQKTERDIDEVEAAVDSFDRTLGK